MSHATPVQSISQTSFSDAGAQPAPSAKWLRWAGIVVSAIPILMLTLSAVMKLSHSPEMVAGFTGKFGYPASTLTAIGLIELLVVVLYAIPRTAVLGAILITGYLGGAVATHVRVADVFVVPLALGTLPWLGLFLRDARVRALLPWRTPAAA